MIHTEFDSYQFMCVDHTIPKNGMLGVTEVSYHFWYDPFFTVCMGSGGVVV